MQRDAREQLLGRIVDVRAQLEELRKLLREARGNKTQERLICDLLERINELEVEVSRGIGEKEA
jgi:hypothetical protein